jgi:hypothetical protein
LPAVSALYFAQGLATCVIGCEGGKVIIGFESGFGADGDSLSELGATSELSFPGESRTQFTPPTIAHRNEAAKPADLPAMQATKLNGRSTRMLGLDVPAMLPGSCRRGDQIKWLSVLPAHE